MFKGKLYVTIDTEMDADIHWKKGFPVSFSSVLLGIPNILRPIWDRYNVDPIYFVSPEVVENEECCNVLISEIKKGAIIGAHLHEEQIEPNRKSFSEIKVEGFPCYSCDKETEYQKIKNLTELIKNNLGVNPKWYRAARFGADMDTMNILMELGYKYDSSITPGIDWSSRGGPDHSSFGYKRFKIYNEKRDSVIEEVPVTVMGKRFGIIGEVLPDNWLFYQWIRPSNMFFWEQKRMLLELRKKDTKEIVMMFHSMEIMIGKTPYVRNKYMQKYFLWKLRRIIEFSRNLGYE